MNVSIMRKKKNKRREKCVQNYILKEKKVIKMNNSRTIKRQLICSYLGQIGGCAFII